MERWLDHDDMIDFCYRYDIPTVPVIFNGQYKQDMYKQFIDINPVSDEINEGVVLKPIKEKTGAMGRFILKFINDKYYLKQEEIDGSEFQ